MAIRTIQPNSDRPLLKENGSPDVQFNSWLKIITDRDLIVGTGSPESVVEANQGTTYMDDAGTASAILYIKRDADIAGDKTQGWILT